MAETTRLSPKTHLFHCVCVYVRLQVWVLTNLFSHFRDGLRAPAGHSQACNIKVDLQSALQTTEAVTWLLPKILSNPYKIRKIGLFTKVASYLRSLAKLRPLVRAC